jgi:hypothetical protein
LGSVAKESKMSGTQMPGTKGLQYAPGITGKHVFRVSEQYVAEHVAALISRRRPDAVKLDLMLRGLALSPEHAGKRRAGTVLRKQTRADYPAFHDLVRESRRFATTRPEEDDNDVAERDKKREWVREQLQVLERRQLLVRDDLGDGRRQIRMLCDLGDGAPFDDPGAVTAAQRPYVTILGNLLISPEFRTWGSAEIVGFLCAMVADRYARNAQKKKGGSDLEPGSATWYRQAHWFNNKAGYRPEGHIALPFSTTTIERGLKAMRSRGYITAERRKRSPEGTRFQHPRLIYTNRFNEVGIAEVIDITTLVKTG